MNQNIQEDPRHWTDQPELLSHGTGLLHAKLGDHFVQVIVSPLEDQYYITTGNLFGSQTVGVPPSDLWKALQLIANLGVGKRPQLPTNWVLLSTEEKYKDRRAKDTQ